MNLPSKVRATLYIISAVVVPVVTYLSQQGKVDAFWLGLVVVINTAILGLARYNVK